MCVGGWKYAPDPSNDRKAEFAPPRGKKMYIFFFLFFFVAQCRLLWLTLISPHHQTTTTTTIADECIPTLAWHATSSPFHPNLVQLPPEVNLKWVSTLFAFCSPSKNYIWYRITLCWNCEALISWASYSGVWSLFYHEHGFVWWDIWSIRTSAKRLEEPQYNARNHC